MADRQTFYEPQTPAGAGSLSGLGQLVPQVASPWTSLLVWPCGGGGCGGEVGEVVSEVAMWMEWGWQSDAARW